MSEFASAPYTAGQLNAMIKKLRAIGGKKGPELLLDDELALVTPTEPPLLKRIETVEVSAVARFVAKEAFKNASMNDAFKQFFLPLVEEDVPSDTLIISELSAQAWDFQIATALGIHQHGRVKVAHILEVVERTNRWFVGYAIGSDGNTWAVGVYPLGVRVNAYADPLGHCNGWDVGDRFLSRDSGPGPV